MNNEHIDIKSILSIITRIETKLDTLLEGVKSAGSKDLTEIPVETKQIMKEMLEKEAAYLSDWEKEFLTSMSTYPRWSEKQKNSFSKIVAELPTKKEVF
jgi:hypothetical protein